MTEKVGRIVRCVHVRFPFLLLRASFGLAFRNCGSAEPIIPNPGGLSNSDPIRSGDAIAWCGRTKRQFRYEPLSGRLKCIPVGSIWQRRNGYQFTLIETRKGSVHHVVSLHDHFAWNLLKRSSGSVPEVGCGCARQNDLNADVTLRKFLME